MTDSERTLDIILKYGTDANSLGNARQGVDGVTNSLRQQEQQLRRNRMEIRELSQVFSLIGIAGAALYAPAIAASQKYIATYAQTELASRKWLAAQKSIEDSTVKIGRVVTEDLLPAYEALAKTAERFAAWAEKNPEAMKTAVNIAGGLVLKGTAGSVFMTVARGVVDLQLVAATLMNAAATKQITAATMMDKGAMGDVALLEGGSALGGMGMAATVGVSAIAIVGGLAISWFVSEGVDMLMTKLGINQKITGIIETNQAAGQRMYPGIIADPTLRANQIAINNGTSAVKDFTGALVTGRNNLMYGTPGNNAALTGGGGVSVPTKNWTQSDALLSSYIDYQTSMKAAQASYEANSLQMQNDYNAASSDLYSKYKTNDARAEADYYQARLDAAATYGTEVLRAEQDHQISMRRLYEDHASTMQDLTASRDGLGMIREMRKYEKERNRAEEDYNIAASRRNQDYGRQMSDMAAAYKKQRDQRLEDYELAAKDLADQNKKKQAALAESLKTENDIIEKAFGARQAALGIIITDAGTAALAMITAYRSQLNAFLKATYASMMGGNYYGSKNNIRDSGGYMYPGMYQNASGANEWALDPRTTKYAESIVGGRLTQQNLIAAMMSGRGGGGGNSRTFNDQRTQNVSGLSSADRLWVRDVMKQTVNAKFAEEL